jgi:hypothetical protein
MAKSDVTRLMAVGNARQGWEVLIHNGARPAPHYVRGRYDADEVARIMASPRVQLVMVMAKEFDLA